ncbi:putative sodium-coupled neutral amino acid transporter 7 [Lamellibrachia satsuma]|nr:putative sodium-coupled neutral amino acid transporter 7 [Lamellibrachia satsuma]
MLSGSIGWHTEHVPKQTALGCEDGFTDGMDIGNGGIVPCSIYGVANGCRQSGVGDKSVFAHHITHTKQTDVESTRVPFRVTELHLESHNGHSGVYAMGVIAVGYCVALVTAKYFVKTDIGHVDIKTKPSHWTDVFIVIPVICFSYQCHLSIVPIYACLRKRTFSEFLRVVLVAIVIMVFTYTVTASFGYLTFGTGINQDILLSYKPTADVLVAVIFVAFKMYTTYPILLFVGRAALDSVWVQMRHLEPEKVASQERCRRILVTLIWFATSLLLAIIVPNIGIVISLLGGFAGLFIFTFPGLCLLQMLLQGYIDQCEQPRRYYTLYAMAVGYLIIGAFIFGLVTTQSLLMDFTSVPTRHVQTPDCN